MPEFSIISQSPEIRQIVQDNALERAFHDALFPKQLFRGEASPVLWPQNVGDTMLFSAPGLIKPKMRPLRPGVDPTPSTYTFEEWSATLQQYADSIDTPMPTSMVAIANLFLRNAHQLGMSAGQSLNRITRNKLYNAALSGWTVCNGGALGTATSIPVMRLNGFTTARRPDLALGSPVRFAAVSAINPLPISIVLDDASVHDCAVTAFTATTSGDEVGPGSITITPAIPGARTVPDRAAIYADDRTYMVRVGGGMSCGSIGAGDLPRLSDLRSAISHFQNQNVPEHTDSRYHMHCDPNINSAFFADPEFQRLMTSLPDYYAYKQFTFGELLGTIVFKNSECPQPSTVDGGTTAVFSQDDPFAGEMYSNGVPATGTEVHRALLSGQGSVFEYYTDLNALITEAGVQGRIGEPRITNNGIEVNTDRIQLLIRSPQNRTMDMVSTTWKFIGDWPIRTDIATGDGARYKRLMTIECAA